MNQAGDDNIENIEDAVVEEPDTTALAVPETTLPSTGLPDPALSFGTLSPDYTDDGLPTFDYVRDRIEGRIATSMGAAELPDQAAAGASIDEQFETREQAGKDRLEQIRRAMRGE